MDIIAQHRRLPRESLEKIAETLVVFLPGDNIILRSTKSLVCFLKEASSKPRYMDFCYFCRVQKWLGISITTAYLCPAHQIARHTGLAEHRICNLVSSYNRLGPQSLRGPSKGNR